MAHPKKICIVCSRLDLPGGTERAVVNLANLLAELNYTVTVLILDETALLFYPLSKNVTVSNFPYDLGINSSHNLFTNKVRFLQQLRSLKDYFASSEFHALIGTEYHLTSSCYLAGRRLIPKIFAWEHRHFGSLPMSRFWKNMVRITYPRLTSVIALNDDEQRLYEAAGYRSVTIPNFIQTSTRFPQARLPRNILSILRFDRVKGFDLLMAVAEIVLKRNPDWTWTIIGSGLTMQEVHGLLKNQTLSDRLLVKLPVSPDLTKEYSLCSFYVMTSRNECFPMVLLEAMNAGRCCVSFDCDTGPRHIIKHLNDGLLIKPEDVSGMAEAICGLINHPEEVERLSENGLQNITRLDSSGIGEAWATLLNEDA